MGKITTVSKLLGLCLPMGLSFLMGSTILWTEVAYADSRQPQLYSTPEDVPEEMLQVQVLLDATSALTGQAQGAKAHAKEQRQLQVEATEVPPTLSPSIYQAVELLRLRKVIKSLLPFL